MTLLDKGKDARSAASPWAALVVEYRTAKGMVCATFRTTGAHASARRCAAARTPAGSSLLNLLQCLSIIAHAFFAKESKSNDGLLVVCQQKVVEDSQRDLMF